MLGVRGACRFRVKGSWSKFGVSGSGLTLGFSVDGLVPTACSVTMHPRAYECHTAAIWQYTTEAATWIVSLRTAGWSCPTQAWGLDFRLLQEFRTHG